MKKSETKKRLKREGQAIVTGIAIGDAQLFGTEIISFPRYWIHKGEVKSEIHRFQKALHECKKQFDLIKSKLCKIQGREQISIIDSHILLLHDELLVQNTIHTIEKECINTEWALDRTIEGIKKAFTKINQAYFRERQDDIHYIENAIQQNLSGKPHQFFQSIPRGAIIIAHDLSPAEVLHLIRYQVKGFVTERGAFSSHTAIVARSLNIPAMIGVTDLIPHVSKNDKIIIDGYQGQLLLNPSHDELESYKEKRKYQMASDRLVRQEAKEKAVTTDGEEIRILANMEFTDEIDAVREFGAHGIGLYRTEFLFLNRETIPGWEEQKTIYQKILKKMSPSEVTIRTLDLGADKMGSTSTISHEENPALGLRAIRYCLREKDIFTTQLRALLAASVDGHLKICLPMISSIDEFRKVKRLFNHVKEDMLREGIPMAKRIPLGIMIETPAAVMELDLLAVEADFFSVGTNDLVQYLLAVDRNNELVSYLYSPLHPSVIRILKRITAVAKQFQREVTLCGEMAGDPQYLMLVIALGFRRLSMNITSIPRIKKMIRACSMDQAEKLLDKVDLSTSYKDTQKLLQSRMEEIFEMEGG